MLFEGLKFWRLAILCCRKKPVILTATKDVTLPKEELQSSSLVVSHPTTLLFEQLPSAHILLTVFIQGWTELHDCSTDFVPLDKAISNDADTV